MANPETGQKRLFITYAWENNAGGDFDFIVQELERRGVEVEFDRVALRGGRRLWEQIAERIENPSLDAWAFLVTPDSLASPSCLEEYYLALGRTLSRRGGDFPLIALAHGVRFDDVPANLRIRLGISLTDPTWPEFVAASVAGRAPEMIRGERDPFEMRWHTVGHSPDNWTLEIRPRLAQIYNWRIAVPANYRECISSYGEGPSGQYTGRYVLWLPFEGIDQDNGEYFFGAQGPIGHGLSAFVSFRGRIPPTIMIGPIGDNYMQYQLFPPGLTS
jgi:hypothetical protein